MYIDDSFCHVPVTPQMRGNMHAMLSMAHVHWTILGFLHVCLCHQETRHASQLLPSHALTIAPLSGKSHRNYKRLTINSITQFRSQLGFSSNTSPPSLFYRIYLHCPINHLLFYWEEYRKAQSKLRPSPQGNPVLNYWILTALPDNNKAQVLKSVRCCSKFSFDSFTDQDVLVIQVKCICCLLLMQQNKLHTGEKRERQKDLIKM